jgi:transcriptional regulator with XRE-family HTH domain
MKRKKKTEETTEELADSLAWLLLRTSKRLDQSVIARAIHLSTGQASNYEQGQSPVRRENLEKAAQVVGFPVSLLDFLRRGLRSFLLAGQGRSRARSAVAERLAMERLDFAREVVDLALAPRKRLRPPQAARPRAEDRAEQAALVAWFQQCTPEEARFLVEETAEYRSWVLCEEAALRSVRLAPNRPQEAREWAALAVRIAELVPGEETWRLRLQGWALHFLSNAERACNDLPAAEKTRAHGRGLWEAGAPGDPGLLNEAWLPWIEAMLRKGQRRFAEALQRIDEALDLDQGELRGQILISKSNILDLLNDPVASTTALLEAEPLIDPQREPRLALFLRFNLLVDLCALGRATEAEPRLPAVAALAARLGEQLDVQRCRWLEGQIHAALGRAEQALEAYCEVRRTFHDRNLAYDYALVSLDLALVLLEQGRTAEVATIASEMLAIFEAQEVHREALAAVRVFCAAAEREAATVQLTRRVARFLRRVELDPELRFEGGAASTHM